MGCLVCGGVPMYLGELGSHTWLRCRDCGIEWGVRTPSCFVPTDEAIEELTELLEFGKNQIGHI